MFRRVFEEVWTGACERASSAGNLPTESKTALLTDAAAA
jgi:hypothetical protein